MVSSPRPPGRPDGRRADELRPVSFTLDYVVYPEGAPFSRPELDRMLDLAERGIGRVVQRQREALM